jgi:hypothetical protein
MGAMEDRPFCRRHVVADVVVSKAPPSLITRIITVSWAILPSVTETHNWLLRKSAKRIDRSPDLSTVFGISSSYIFMIKEGLGACILHGSRRSVYTQGTKTATFVRPSSTHQTLTRQKGRRADNDEKSATGCQSRNLDDKFSNTGKRERAESQPDKEPRRRLA